MEETRTTWKGKKIYSKRKGWEIIPEGYRRVRMEETRTTWKTKKEGVSAWYRRRGASDGPRGYFECLSLLIPNFWELCTVCHSASRPLLARLAPPPRSVPSARVLVSPLYYEPSVRKIYEQDIFFNAHEHNREGSETALNRRGGGGGQSTWSRR